MLTEELGYKMEVLEDGQIQICKISHILRDGIEISRALHRHVLEPGQDIADQNAKVKAIAGAVWTKEVIDKYKVEKMVALEKTKTIIKEK